MGVAAPARNAPVRAPARKRPARRAPARRNTHPITPPGGHLIPLAVGRTAVAVRGLPDSGLVMRITRGRAWIGVLSMLLAGIVALNVVSLSLSASSGRIAQQTQALEQENSALRAQLALRLSDSRVQEAAASLGMFRPDAADMTYSDASPSQIGLAATRLVDGFGGGSTSSSYVSTVDASTTSATTASATSIPVASTTPAIPSTTATAPTATSAPPPATATATTAPTAPASVPPSTGSAGGLATG